jgi:transcriptional regulator with XRE-family HTH domain
MSSKVRLQNEAYVGMALKFVAVPRKALPDESFGQRLARLRRARALTQAELGEKIGISRRNVAYYESQTSRPPAHVLDKIASVLRVSADELLGLRAIEGDAPVNLRIWRRFRIIEDLTATERMVVWKFITTLTKDRRKQGGRV